MADTQNAPQDHGPTDTAEEGENYVDASLEAGAVHRPSPPATPAQNDQFDQSGVTPKDIGNRSLADVELAAALSLMDSFTLDKRRKSLNYLRQLATDHPLPDKPSVVFEHRDKIRFKKFSGSSPIPNGEVSFSVWKLSVLPRLEDGDSNLAQVRDAIIDSLLPPALNSITTVRREPPRAIFNFLETLYGSVDDPEELLIEFAGICTADREASSVFLKRLHLFLIKISDIQPMRANEFDRRLRAQFVRGCGDEELLLKLRLDDEHGISTMDLMTLVKTEEAKRLQKRARLGLGKARLHQMSSGSPDSQLAGVVSRLEAIETRLTDRSSAFLNPGASSFTPMSMMATASSANTGASAAGSTSDTSSVFTRLAALEARLVCPPAVQQPHPPVSLMRSVVPATDRGSATPGFAIFCFRCGNDGHLAVECAQAPNCSLVNEKVAARRQWRRSQKHK